MVVQYGAQIGQTENPQLNRIYFFCLIGDICIIDNGMIT